MSVDWIPIDERQNDNKVNILGVGVSCFSMAEILTAIDIYISQKRGPLAIFPANIDLIMKAQNDPIFKNILNEANLVPPDGVPVCWAGRILALNGPKETASGSDLFPKVCDLAAVKGYSIFLVGAAPGISEKAVNVLQNQRSNIRITGAYSPSMAFGTDEQEQKKVVKIVNDANPDILFVGLGAPKQEKFLWFYRQNLNVPVSIAVGGTFDRVAGKFSRAPFWMQKNGLEWMWRLYQEPTRLWRRYLVDDMPFFWLVLKQKIEQLKGKSS